jgi:hypothetical protein
MCEERMSNEDYLIMVTNPDLWAEIQMERMVAEWETGVYASSCGGGDDYYDQPDENDEWY